MRKICLLQQYVLLLILGCSTNYCARILSKDRTIPVIGQPLTLTYNNNETAVITNRITFLVSESLQGICRKMNGSCGSGQGNNITRSAPNVIRLVIPEFNATRHAGSWIVREGKTNISNYLNLTPPFYQELLNSSIHVGDALPTQEQIDSKEDFNVSISIDCTYPSVNMSWVFGKSQTLIPVTTNDGSMCTSPQTKTFAVLTMNNKTGQGRVHVTVQLVHPSFENGVRNIQIGYAVFPVPVANVTFQNISSQNEKIETSEGSITLICVTSPSNPAASISWYKNGSQINRSVTNTTEQKQDNLTVTTGSLSLTVSRSDMGHTLYCMAGITGQKPFVTSNTGILNVWYGPHSVTFSPSSPGTVKEGGNLTVNCSADCNPPCSYSWTLGTQQLSRSSLLTLADINRNQKGMYTCTVNNTFIPKSGSGQFSLTVFYSPRIQIKMLTSNPHKEGDDLDLTCTADSNPSSPQQFKWIYGRYVMNGGNRSNLRLTNLNRTDHGQYKCEVTVSADPYGNLTNSSNIQVVVNYAPNVTLTALNSTENNSSSIMCSADGRPGNMTFTSFSHYWNDVFIRDVSGTPVGHNETRLTFNRATYEDSGAYYCTVNNGVPDRSGNKPQTATSYVYIGATPKITKETELDIPVGAEIGKPAILQKTVFSKPDNISFNWNRSDSNSTFNYTNIKPENITLEIYGKTVNDSGYRISLNISSFSQEDIGTYTLNVCNGVGCSQFSVNLTAAGPPRPPKKFQQEGESSHTVRLSWLPNYPGGKFKQRFILEYKLQSESEWMTEWTSDWSEYLPQNQKMFYNITNLKANQVYDVRLSAENDRPKDNVSVFVNITAMTAKEAKKLSGPGSGIGAAVGGAVGSVAVVGVIVVLVVFFVRRSRLSSKNKKDTENGLRTNRDSENLPALPVLDDNELYFMSGGGGGGGDAPNRGDDASKPKLPVLEDNDLYFSSGGVKKMELPVLEDNELYYTSQGSGVKGQKEPVSQTSPMRDGAQPSTSTQNDDKKDNKKGQKEMKKTQDDKKAEKNKKKKEQEKSKDKEKKAKDADKKVKKGKKGDKMPLNQAARGDAYENVDLGKDNTYANAAFDGKEDEVCQNVQGAKCGRDEDGLVYVGIDFSSTTPSRSVHKTEESVEYMSIDWNKKAQPLPDGDEPKKEKSEK